MRAEGLLHVLGRRMYKSMDETSEEVGSLVTGSLETQESQYALLVAVQYTWNLQRLTSKGRRTAALKQSTKGRPPTGPRIRDARRNCPTTLLKMWNRFLRRAYDDSIRGGRLRSLHCVRSCLSLDAWCESRR